MYQVCHHTDQYVTLATGPMPKASEIDPGLVESQGPLARWACVIFGLIA